MGKTLSRWMSWRRETGHEVYGKELADLDARISVLKKCLAHMEHTQSRLISAGMWWFVAWACLTAAGLWGDVVYLARHTHVRSFISKGVCWIPEAFVTTIWSNLSVVPLLLLTWTVHLLGSFLL